MVSTKNAKEGRNVGRTVTPATVENIADLIKLHERLITPDKVRHIEIPEALVDTGATFLSLPKSMIQKLGLEFQYTRLGITPGGPRRVKVYSPVRLSVQGRFCMIDVAEVSERAPVLIGQIPLEIMDFVVDPRRGKIIPNPAHGGEWTIELL
jgi:predicted aspartyl protease